MLGFFLHTLMFIDLWWKVAIDVCVAAIGDVLWHLLLVHRRRRLFHALLRLVRWLLMLGRQRLWLLLLLLLCCVHSHKVWRRRIVSLTSAAVTVEHPLLVLKDHPVPDFAFHLHIAHATLLWRRSLLHLHLRLRLWSL